MLVSSLKRVARNIQYDRLLVSSKPNSFLHRTFYCFSTNNNKQASQKPEEKNQQKKPDQNLKNSDKNKNKSKEQHQHGPNCNHKQSNNTKKKQETQESMKGSKSYFGSIFDNFYQKDILVNKASLKLEQLTFDELVQLNSEEALQQAHKLYEKQHEKLTQLIDYKQQLIKDVQILVKIEDQIQEKEQKLVQNIAQFEEYLNDAIKRSNKQIQDSKPFGIKNFAREILQVADCIDNCVKYSKQISFVDEYIKNVLKSQEILKEIFKQYQIEEFDPLNQQFDPNTQQSMATIPTPPGFKQNQVSMTFRTGYTLKGRLLRSARVGVFS